MLRAKVLVGGTVQIVPD